MHQRGAGRDQEMYIKETVRISEERVSALKTAIAEAERFISCAGDAIRHYESDEYAPYHSKPNASAKRASMDLSNALIKVRK